MEDKLGDILLHLSEASFGVEDLYLKSVAQLAALDQYMNTLKIADALINYLIKQSNPELEKNIMFLSLKKKYNKSNDKLREYLTKKPQYVIIEEEDERN
jgi:hypothetical protein